ncbi:MAG: zinc metalloprotease HtpX [Actinobacteria bacterium]|nr:zinc metalloprotease HtpX [Thermoleophilia bacterium]MCB9010510.1 zinc metalloprotease HtpX [Actinomycetota bacterium]MCB9010612.1 zinc metalloprotease HtpX [Actinomycetota bacterium]
MNPTARTAGNTFKTFALMGALTALLLVIGQLVGGGTGLMFFAIIAIGFNFFAYWFSGPMALKMSRAQEVSEQQAPELHHMVATLSARAGIPKPKVYMTPAEQPNAFATGRNPKHAAVAVTQGLMQQLTPREVEGVIAHELAHVKNRDILIASVAAMIAGAISAIVNFLQFSLLFGGGDDDGNPLGLIGSIAAIILAPIAAMVVQMAISRQREYIADATGARFLGDPMPLADALVRLHQGAHAIPMNVNQAAAPLYIVNPLSGFGRKMSGLFSTHPPMEERVRRLRAMSVSRTIS